MIPLYDTVRSRKFPIINLAADRCQHSGFLIRIAAWTHTALERFIFTWGLIPSLLHERSSLGAGRTSLLPCSCMAAGSTSSATCGCCSSSAIMWKHAWAASVTLIFYLAERGRSPSANLYPAGQSSPPMIGASGAIAGVLGAYLILFPRSRIASLVPILFIFTIIEIPAVIFLLFWFISQLYSGLFAIRAARERNCLVGAYWRISIWRSYGIFLCGREKAIYRDWQYQALIEASLREET